MTEHRWSRWGHSANWVWRCRKCGSVRVDDGHAVVWTGGSTGLRRASDDCDEEVAMGVLRS